MVAPAIISLAVDNNAISYRTIKEAYSAFIESKHAEAISERSISPLSLRVGHFVKWTHTQRPVLFSRKAAMDYRSF
ncbi:MAG: hypothetical protein HRU22_13380 [Gammaproteobacteria bacterium]|nr:hypothetical protein [Gammaproteobacteria bacterium]